MQTQTAPRAVQTQTQTAAAHGFGFGFAPGGGFGVTSGRHDDRDAKTPFAMPIRPRWEGGGALGWLRRLEPLEPEIRLLPVGIPRGGAWQRRLFDDEVAHVVVKRILERRGGKQRGGALGLARGELGLARGELGIRGTRMAPSRCVRLGPVSSIKKMEGLAGHPDQLR